jgi:hypothetical protein
MPRLGAEPTNNKSQIAIVKGTTRGVRRTVQLCTALQFFINAPFRTRHAGCRTQQPRCHTMSYTWDVYTCCVCVRARAWVLSVVPHMQTPCALHVILLAALHGVASLARIDEDGARAVVRAAERCVLQVQHGARHAQRLREIGRTHRDTPENGGEGRRGEGMWRRSGARGR